MWLIVSGKGTNEIVEDYSGSKKLLVVEDLPTLTDLECAKGYLYHDAIDLVDNADVGSDGGEDEVDDALYMEMVFDETSVVINDLS